MKNFNIEINFRQTILKVTLFLLLSFLGFENLKGQTWLKHYTSADQTMGADIVEASNGDLLITTSDGSSKVLRVDSDGDLIWSIELPTHTKGFAGHNNHIIKSSDNNFIIVGVDSVFNNQDTLIGIYISKIDNAGNSIWNTTYTNPDIDFNRIDGLIESNDGGIFITAQYNHVLKFNETGIFDWMETYNSKSISSIIQANNGDLVFTGTTYDPITETSDVFLMSTTSLGDSLWIKTFGSGNYRDRGIDLIQTADNGFAILSRWQMNPNPGFLDITGRSHIIKTNVQGDSLWGSTISAPGIWPWRGGSKRIHQRSDGGFDMLINRWVINATIAQVDVNGNILNNNPLPSNSLVGLSFIPCSNGGYAVTGQNISISQPFIAKANAQGEFFSKFIQGNIFRDENLSCDFDTLELGIANWTVSVEDSASSVITYATTDSLGNYSINVNEGTYEVTAQIPSPIWQSCLGMNPQTVTVDTLADTMIVNFPIQGVFDCPLLTVDISAPLLRRCFNNTYTVEYCNEGTQPAINAFVEVRLDDFFDPDSTTASIPFFSQGDSILIFTVGDIGIGECGTFSINVYLDCNSTVIGQTHCTEAHIFPDTVCFPINPLWDLSSISLEGRCESDSVFFRIKNEGTGDMAMPRDYRIVIDEVIMFEGMFDLDSGETMEVAVEAMSQTYRMEADQAPEHPGNSMPSTTVEGCANFGSLGFFTWFPQDDEDKFIDIDCQENIASFDPNDKQAFPRGYHDEHFIEPETELEYKIRFQNTGTDTAFTVVVRDTLSEHFDISTFRMGVSSHHNNWKIIGNRVLKVTYDNIMLPDSNINELASHGFFKYEIKPKATVPLGTVVENRAGIYFDFNEPVLTNTTFHTLGENYVLIDIVDVENLAMNLSSLKVFPNPFQTSTTFEIENGDFKTLELEVFDVMGRKIKTIVGSGNRLTLNADGIDQGVYFFKILGNEKLFGSGKLILTK